MLNYNNYNNKNICIYKKHHQQHYINNKQNNV